MQTYGGYYGSTNSPYDILNVDPEFVNYPWTTSDDLQLTGSSPGSGAASDESSPGQGDGTDRGAWGGTGTYDTSFGTGYGVPMDW